MRAIDGTVIAAVLATALVPGATRAAGVSVSCPTAPPQAGSTFVSQIAVDAAAAPLGAYTLVVTYDQTVVTIASIAGGTTSEFSGAPVTDEGTFTSGMTRLSAFNGASKTSPSGQVSIARVTFNAVGAPGSSSALGLQISKLADTDGNPISADTAGCTVTLTAPASVTPTDTATVTASSTPTGTTTQTPTASASQTPTEALTVTPITTATPTPSASLTATPSPTQSETPTETPTQTSTRPPGATETATATSTPTPTSTPTQTLTDSATTTPSSTPTVAASETPSATPTQTSTGTATFTLRATPTTTVTTTTTPTTTGTVTATPTRTVPSPAACGNGVLDPGEECDDGNLVDGDGCSATCTSDLIPGGGSSKLDCTQEWLSNPVALRRDGGLPKPRLECVDDDAACDFGGRTGDKACTFHIALCFNVTEVRFRCDPTGVARVDLRDPQEDNPQGPVETANRDALEAALAGLGGLVRGQCKMPGPGPDNLCTADSDCRSKQGKQGECRDRFVVFDPPLDTADTCTEFAPVVVPLKHAGRDFKSNKATLKLAITPASTGARSRDTDSLQLICQPRNAR